MCRLFEGCKTAEDRAAVAAHLAGQASASFQQSATAPDTPQMTNVVEPNVVPDHIGTGDAQEFNARLALGMK